jgi:hypothetical protein
MAVVGTILKTNVGIFTVKFSSKNGLFEIVNPDVFTKIRGNDRLSTWQEVNEEIDRRCAEYLHEELFVRKVIIIQLKTSASDYTMQQKKWNLDNKKADEIETVISSDKLDRDGSGFLITWCIANEYRVGDVLKYKIIQAHKSSKYTSERLDIIEQTTSDYNGERRIVTYSEEMHQWLDKFENDIDLMLQKLYTFFDRDATKFLQNFQNKKLLLLNSNT